MPRSKRARVVHLSKTTKKGKELSIKLHTAIQGCIPQYPYIYIFRVNNMRNTYLKDVRTQLSDSRIFFGKTKVMAVALGLGADSEPFPGTSSLTPYLHGNVGLLFSPRAPLQIIEYFENFQPIDYARAGTVASRTFIIPSGIVYSRAGEIAQDEDVHLAHSVEPLIRKWGVPTKLVKGKIELENDFIVCNKGETLGSAQTALLKLFGVVTAAFVVAIEAYYDRETEAVEPLQSKVPMDKDEPDYADMET